jgi:hypothetical protein
LGVGCRAVMNLVVENGTVVRTDEKPGEIPA